MSTTGRDAYTAAIARVRKYAEGIRQGERRADQDSLDRAADLKLIYDDKRWVKELEAEGKAPKNKVYRGRPVIEDSYNRFTSWVLTHEGLGPSYTKRLLRVDDWRANYGATGTVIPTEAAIRPLYALERRGRGEQTPEVIARAAELAGEGPITTAHTRQAVSEFWAKYSPGEKRRMDRDAQAKRHATTMRREAQWLIDNGYLETLADTLTELDRLGDRAANES